MSYTKQYYIKNKDIINERSKKYYEENKDTIQIKHRIYSKNYYEKNKEALQIRHRKYNKLYYMNNNRPPEKYLRKTFDINDNSEIKPFDCL